ncbi:MAG: cbb3-type cytochrome c oxidase subunit 3 [Magnetococcales bacterium]|nr:cbb3-type cytochrome c oxidase subunit 3 [Magnetococcales bacterium]
MDFDTLMLLSKEFALILFFLVFVGIVAYVYLPGNKNRFEKAGRMALDDDKTSPMQD